MSRPGRKIYFGKLGEDYAEKLLKNNGYRIIERNYRNKIGEIDIVCEEKDTIVFVEVKTRWSKKYGEPEEAVDHRKIRKIERIGQMFVKDNSLESRKLRIDVVAINIERRAVKNAKIIKVSNF